MDPLTAAAIAGGSNLIGGMLNAGAAKDQSQLQSNIEQMLGQRGLDVQSAAVGDQIRRQLESMPERDRALYMLQARLGNTPSRFSPSGVFAQSGQAPNAGGIDFGAMQKAAQAYTPGAGGTRPDLAAQMMNRLGYSPQGGNTGFTPPGQNGVQGNPWQQALNQKFSSLAQPWSNAYTNTNNGSLGFRPNDPTTTGGLPSSTPQQLQAQQNAARIQQQAGGGLFGDVMRKAGQASSGSPG